MIKHNNYFVSGTLEVRKSDVTAASKFGDKKISFGLNSADRIQLSVSSTRESQTKKLSVR